MDTTLSFDRAAGLVLDYLSENLPLAMWSVTRVENNRQTFLYVNEENGYEIGRGDFTPWEDTFCISMVAGRTPTVTATPLEIPEYRRAAEVNDLEIGTYAGAVIDEPDGRLFGTICGIDPSPRLNADALAQATPLLSFMGDMLTLSLEADRDREHMRDTLSLTEHDADTDALTGLANRRLWDRVVSEEEGRFRRFADPTIVVMVDLDRLKVINDSEGHAAGDAYLRTAGEALRAAVRSTDIVARIGGDEFAVLLRQCDVEAAGLVVANIDHAFVSRGVAASLGWAPASVPQGLGVAIATADASMYAAKAARRLG